jgi:hypothetical protein
VPKDATFKEPSDEKIEPGMSCNLEENEVALAGGLTTAPIIISARTGMSKVGYK